MIMIVIYGQVLFIIFLRMLCDWFKFMFFIFCYELMSKMEKFVQWLFLLVYCLGGFIFLVVFKFYGIILNVEYIGCFEGYVCLVGFGVVEIGFFFIILVCFIVRIYCYGIILVFVVSCFVWVLVMGFMFIFRNMVFFMFVLVFMGLDVLFFLSILFIWCWERDGFLLGDFLKEFLVLF